MAWISALYGENAAIYERMSSVHHLNQLEVLYEQSLAIH